MEHRRIGYAIQGSEYRLKDLRNVPSMEDSAVFWPVDVWIHFPSKRSQSVLAYRGVMTVGQSRSHCARPVFQVVAGTTQLLGSDLASLGCSFLTSMLFAVCHPYRFLLILPWLAERRSGRMVFSGHPLRP
jgi:hypothetical protein